MPEELRIIVTDTAGPGGGSTRLPGFRGPSAPGRTSIPIIPAAPQRVPSALSSGQGVGRALATGRIGAAVAGTVGIAGLSGAAAIAAPIGIAVGVLATGIGLAAAAVGVFARVVKAQVGLLAPVSGAVAVAQSQSEVDRTFAELRRGRRIGGDLAGAERLRSQFATEIFDVNTEILSVALRIFNAIEPGIQFISGPLLRISEFIEQRGAAFVTFVFETLDKLTGGFFTFAQQFQKFLDAFGGQDQAGDIDPFFREFFNMGVRDQPGGIHGDIPPMVGGPPFPVGP